jgi:hypothetical protein
LYESLAAARANIRQGRRHASISKVLHRKIRAAVDPTTADIAVAVYDLDEIAARLASGADYDGLTALIAADLTPARIAARVPEQRRGRRGRGREDGDEGASASRASIEQAAVERPVIGAGPAEPIRTEPIRTEPVRTELARVEQVTVVLRGAGSPALPEFQAPVLPDPAAEADLRDELPVERAVDGGQTELVEERGRVDELGLATPRPVEPVRPTRVDPVVLGTVAPKLAPDPIPAGARDGSLRGRVYAALDAHVPAGDNRDNTTLIALVAERLQLTPEERKTAATYVRAWRRDVDAGRRTPTVGRRLRSVQPEG